MSMKLNLKNNTNGKPTVDIDAEVFVDIPNELYVSMILFQIIFYARHELIKINSLSIVVI